eukprot:Filipodium_phascolosomae@DN4910_c0_g1_i1.p2
MNINRCADNEYSASGIVSGGGIACGGGVGRPRSGVSVGGFNSEEATLFPMIRRRTSNKHQAVVAACPFPPFPPFLPNAGGAAGTAAWPGTAAVDFSSITSCNAVWRHTRPFGAKSSF